MMRRVVEGASPDFWIVGQREVFVARLKLGQKDGARGDEEDSGWITKLRLLGWKQSQAEEEEGGRERENFYCFSKQVKLMNFNTN
jgi:hypothetical protein